MKKFLVPVIIAAITIISCNKENNTTGMVNGTITGPDLGMCPCCGGDFIVIGDSSVSATTYRIDSVPPQSSIDLVHGPFPIDVSLTYRIDSSKCAGMYIMSDDIRRR